jgi:D-amino-acid oxidase
MARVIVVGAGVVGLSCAVRLLEHGHHVDVVARDLPLETTSAVAAALWYPYRARPYDRVAGWARTGYAELARLAELGARDGGPETGVRMRAGTELHPAPAADPWWRDAVPELTRVSPLPSYADAWSFVAPVVEMPVHLRWLVARVEALGGTLTRMALPALPDRADVVVDAAGLGARRLADDPSVRPVRGQVVLVGQVGLDD